MLHQEKWSRFSAFKASLPADLDGREKLRLIKDWMAEINESQRAELTLILKRIRAAGLALYQTKTNEGTI